MMPPRRSGALDAPDFIRNLDARRVRARAARLQHADADRSLRAVATLMRSCVAFASLLVLVGCGIAPQLAPTAAGCYALQTDSVPDAFRAALVPPLPALVRLDTARGGHLQVPVEWLEAGGHRVRYAWLGLQRPMWELLEGEVVAARDVGRLLPPDSLVLAFGAYDLTLTALLAAQPSGDWAG